MKIFLDSIGCRLNQSEIESMALQFRKAGHELVGEATQADLVVVNTCAVTAAASSDSRQHIRQAARLGQARIVVTGCWATLDPKTAENLPSVIRVVTNAEKERLVHEVLGTDVNEKEIQQIARIPLPGIHQRTRAFIKVQDGCNNNCTYCITRVARGQSRSQPLIKILEDIQSAELGGTKEIVLTGAQLGSWGRELTPKSSLINLIRTIFNETSIARLRLSSLEPWEIQDDFFDVLENPRFCRHLHLPLQSGSEQILKLMSRRMMPEDYDCLVINLHEKCPEIAITTDIMVGFPGETDDEFARTCEFVSKQRFTNGHVFTFSPRPQTPAFDFPNHVPKEVMKKRSQIMRDIVSRLAAEYKNKYIGKVNQVLWERSCVKDDGRWSLEGFTDNYLRVQAVFNKDLWNEFSLVKIIGVTGEKLNGEISI